MIRPGPKRFKKKSLLPHVKFFFLATSIVALYFQITILDKAIHTTTGSNSTSSFISSLIDAKTFNSAHRHMLQSPKLPINRTTTLEASPIDNYKLRKQIYSTEPIAHETLYPPVPQSSPWAYGFLLGGVRSQRPDSDYRTGLLSVVAATHQLRKNNSTADVVLMIQISADASPDDESQQLSPNRLEDWEEELLFQMKVRTVFIPRFASPALECFYSLVQEKFRILTLTEYTRVIFLDYDVFPRQSLDYIFELSDPTNSKKDITKKTIPSLRENVVLGFKTEPSNAGIFMLKPNASDFILLQDVIHKKEKRAMKLHFPYWDENLGWGHKIKSPDFWVSPLGEEGNQWTWPYAYADQGLLYHWTKYVKKSVSLVRPYVVENWGVDVHHNLIKESTSEGMLNDESHCLSSQNKKPAPYCDFTHFTGNAKPWKVNRTDVEIRIQTLPKKELTDKELWYLNLKEALEENQMLDRIPLNILQKEGNNNPSVGQASTYVQMMMYIKAKRRNGWNQYERRNVKEGL